MNLSDLSLDDHTHSRKVKFSAAAAQLHATDFAGSPDSAGSSSSTWRRDEISHRAAGDRSIQSAISPEQSRLAQIHISITQLLSGMQHQLPQQQIATWRQAFEQSRHLEFSDSATLHRDAIAQIIAHIGLLREDLTDVELKNVFKAEAYKPDATSRRAFHRPVEDAMCAIIDSRADAKSRLAYINNMFVVLGHASLEQKYTFIRLLFEIADETNACERVSDNDFKALGNEMSPWRRAMLITTLRNYSGGMEDLIRLLFSNSDSFATDESRRTLLARAKQFPNREAVSTRLTASRHLS